MKPVLQIAIKEFPIPLNYVDTIATLEKQINAFLSEEGLTREALITLEFRNNNSVLLVYEKST